MGDKGVNKGDLPVLTIMSESSKNNTTPGGGDRGERQSTRIEQPSFLQRAVAPRFDIGLPFGYTSNIPFQTYGHLPSVYSSIGSIYNATSINLPLAQQLSGQGPESMLQFQLPPLQSFSQSVSEFTASLREQRNVDTINMDPPQIADSCELRIEQSARRPIPPLAKIGASNSRAEISVNDSSQAKSELSKPKRPLSAYNIFFQKEREKIIQEKDCDRNKNTSTDSSSLQKQRYQRNGTGFEDLAKEISKRWKSIDKERLDECNQLADADTERYQKELAEFNGLREAKLAALHQEQMASVSEEVLNRYLAEAESQKPPRKRMRKKK